MPKRFVVAVPILLFFFSIPANAQLPVHTIEGVGGGAITPIALLVNSGGPPTISATVVSLNDKNLETLAVTQSFGGRIEVGYAATRLGLGDLPRDILTVTTVDIDRETVFLHHFNARAILVQQGSVVPAIALGASVKFNSDVDDIDTSLGGALGTIDYSSDLGVDWTLTATKVVENAPQTLHRQCRGKGQPRRVGRTTRFL